MNESANFAPGVDSPRVRRGRLTLGKRRTAPRVRANDFPHVSVASPHCVLQGEQRREQGAQLAGTAFLLFGKEAQRQSSAPVTSAMIVDLLGKGAITREEAASLVPSFPEGAGGQEAAAFVDQLRKGHKKLKDIEKDLDPRTAKAVRNMLDREVALVKKFVQSAAAAGIVVDDKDSLESAIRQMVRQFFALR